MTLESGGWAGRRGEDRERERNTDWRGRTGGQRGGVCKIILRRMQAGPVKNLVTGLFAMDVLYMYAHTSDRTTLAFLSSPKDPMQVPTTGRESVSPSG